MAIGALAARIVIGASVKLALVAPKVIYPVRVVLNEGRVVILDSRHFHRIILNLRMGNVVAVVLYGSLCPSLDSRVVV